MRCQYYFFITLILLIVAAFTEVKFASILPKIRKKKTMCYFLAILITLYVELCIIHVELVGITQPLTINFGIIVVYS